MAISLLFWYVQASLGGRRIDLKRCQQSTRNISHSMRRTLRSQAFLESNQTVRSAPALILCHTNWPCSEFRHPRSGSLRLVKCCAHRRGCSSYKLPEILGVSKSASKAEIRKAYHKVGAPILELLPRGAQIDSLTAQSRRLFLAILTRYPNMREPRPRQNSRRRARRMRFYTMTRSGTSTIPTAWRPSIPAAEQVGLRRLISTTSYNSCLA